MRVDRQTLKQALKDPKQGLVGSQFNRYEILAPIGKGGSGAVFRAKHKELGSLVALKLLIQDDPSPGVVERFKREGRVLAKLKHPNVVGISDLGEENGVSFLAMELIEGDDLHRMVRGPGGAPLEPQEAIEITLAIARALQHCHESGAFHRDVKPKNILMEHGTRRPVLTDFGLAKPDPTRLGSGSDAGPVTMAGELVGTPSFMAPEQFDPGGAFGNVGPKTDVWGLGATLFFLLTGQPPFDARNVVDLYAAVTGEPVRQPQHLRPGLPDPLNALVMRCLTKQVSERIDIPGLIAELARLQGGMRQAGARRGIRHASFIFLVFAGLLALELAWLHPERGRALLRLVRGQGAAAAEPEAGEGAPGDAAALEQAARGGDPQAMLRLGLLLHRGQGLARDDAKAGEWLRAAAGKGEARAMVWLGYLHEQGLGLPGPDPAGALRWYRQAVERGDEAVRSQASRRVAALKAEHPDLR